VFIDTLGDPGGYEPFGESYGSYPVLRIQDHDGNDLAARIDGNPVRGRIPAKQLLRQFESGRAAYAR